MWVKNKKINHFYLSSPQLGHIEGDPVRRGAFPVTFVHFIADWRVTLDLRKQRWFSTQQTNNPPSSRCRRHRQHHHHHHHHLHWQLEWACLKCHCCIMTFAASWCRLGNRGRRQVWVSPGDSWECMCVCVFLCLLVMFLTQAIMLKKWWL